MTVYKLAEAAENYTKGLKIFAEMAKSLVLSNLKSANIETRVETLFFEAASGDRLRLSVLGQHYELRYTYSLAVPDTDYPYQLTLWSGEKSIGQVKYDKYTDGELTLGGPVRVKFPKDAYLVVVHLLAKALIPKE